MDTQEETVEHIAKRYQTIREILFPVVEINVDKLKYVSAKRSQRTKRKHKRQGR